MFTHGTLLLFSLSGLFLPPACSRIPHSPSPCPWKCIRFVQMWPGSFCVALQQKFQCVLPPGSNSWTIHGLWPNKVQNCCGCWRLFRSDLGDLSPLLDQHWPTFLNLSNIHFWQEEWWKHGTCAACLETLSSPSKFFGAALKLREVFNIDRAFQRAGIVPTCSHSYQLDSLQAALKPVLGEENELQCATDGQGREVLVQVQVSLFQNLSRACKASGPPDGTVSPYHRCRAQAPILFVPPDPARPRDPCP
ncbi:ribonuclease T2-like [Ornithorhynchus anatinus]|uniref:ribonuclease T2-like n=1 Tax=Ornithorhynchus anatinus TaxID=9258 RepID=UPI0010A902BD|nr:ribonuclease T2-like [Ornithorhynchus anatinus]